VPTALVTLKVPAGLKVLVAMLVHWDRGSATFGRGEDIVVPLSEPLVPLNMRLVPESVTLLMPGTGTTVETMTRFKLPPLTEIEAVAPGARPLPVTVTVGLPTLMVPPGATWIKL